MSSSGGSTSVNDKSNACLCGKGPCKEYTSKKEHTRGRRFRICPNNKGLHDKGCGNFERMWKF